MRKYNIPVLDKPASNLVLELYKEISLIALTMSNNDPLTPEDIKSVKDDLYSAISFVGATCPNKNRAEYDYITEAIEELADRRNKMSQWVAAQRKAYAEGTLTPAAIKLLEEIPQWQWDNKKPAVLATDNPVNIRRVMLEQARPRYGDCYIHNGWLVELYNQDEKELHKKLRDDPQTLALLTHIPFAELCDLYDDTMDAMSPFFSDEEVAEAMKESGGSKECVYADLCEKEIQRELKKLDNKSNRSIRPAK